MTRHWLVITAACAVAEAAGLAGRAGAQRLLPRRKERCWEVPCGLREGRALPHLGMPPEGWALAALVPEPGRPAPALAASGTAQAAAVPAAAQLVRVYTFRVFGFILFGFSGFKCLQQEGWLNFSSDAYHSVSFNRRSSTPCCSVMCVRLVENGLYQIMLYLLLTHALSNERPQSQH